MFVEVGRLNAMSTDRPATTTELSQDSISALEYLTQQEELGSSFCASSDWYRIFCTRYLAFLIPPMHRATRPTTTSPLRMPNVRTRSVFRTKRRHLLQLLNSMSRLAQSRRALL